MVTVQMPFNYVPNPVLDRALFNGNVYFGQPNTDPLQPSNRVQVRVVEQDGSFTNIAQPVQTGGGGVFLFNGAPVQLDIVEIAFSIVITDNNNVQLYSFPNAGPGGTTGREGLISSGGLPFDDTVTTTGPTFVVTTDNTNALILCDCTSNNITLNLPSAALTGDKFRFIVKKTDSSANTVTIDADGSDLIDGAATFVISTQNEATEFLTDGSAWYGISSFAAGIAAQVATLITRSLKNERQVRNTRNRITLITATNATYNPPRDGRIRRLIACGPGGNAINRGGGGGGGVAIVQNDDLVTTDTLNITIGAGGSGVATTITGTLASGTILNLSGGAGGNGTGASTAGTGGTATGGDLNLTGGNGGTSNGNTGGGGGSIGGFDPNAPTPFENNGYNGGTGSTLLNGGGGGGAGTGGDGGSVGGFSNGGGGGGSAGAAIAQSGGSTLASVYGGPGIDFAFTDEPLAILTGRGGNGAAVGDSGESGGPGGGGGGGGGTGGNIASGGSGGFGAGGGGGAGAATGLGGPGGLGGGAGGNPGASINNVFFAQGGGGFVMIIWDESE